MTLADAALLFGPDEALAHPAPPAVLALPTYGLAGRVDGRLELHSNASEAASGPFTGGAREEAGVTGWWRPLERGPRLFASAALRQRQFVTAYQGDGIGSFAATVVQPVFGPASAYGGGAALLANGGFPTRGFADVFAGLTLDASLGPGLALGGGYQLDRVLDPSAASFTGHALRLAASYQRLAPWRFDAEELVQLRFLDGGIPTWRDRFSLAGERPVWRDVRAGLELQAIVNAEVGGALGLDFVAAPRVRCEF